MLEAEELRGRFESLDQELFEGRLKNGTVVQIMEPREGVDLAEDIDGYCRNDGSEIRINPVAEEWECTLVHEMVHAFEYRFPDDIKVTEEGELASRRYPALFYEKHTAKFFTKLLEVMRARGHEPEQHFHRYFG